MKSELTVIVPNYNKEKYIVQCIESIMKQSILPEEIIVIDDCSSDNSVSILEDLKITYPLLTLVKLPHNSGVSHARNVGLKLAKTKYVTTLDSDDFIYNHNKFKMELKQLNDAKNQLSVAYSAVVIVNTDGKIIKKKSLESYPKGNILEYLLTQKIHYVPRDFCINRSALLALDGYNESMNLYEDLDLLYRIARDHVFLFTNEYGIAYRSVPNGLSKQDDKRHDKVLRELFKKYINYLPTKIGQAKIMLIRFCYRSGKKIKDILVER